MCGRYVSVASTADLSVEFDVEEVEDDDLEPNYNVAPTDPVRAIARRAPYGQDEPRRVLKTFRWGLVPAWSKDAKGAARMINARSETVASKPAFKKAAGKQRCLIPALGYYEWQKADDGTKVPWFLHDPERATVAMAGLYELWRVPDKADDDPDRWLWTCTVITRAATDALGHIHDRTPVLVPQGRWADWLDCSDQDPATAERLLAAIPEPRLEPDVVSDRVNKVANNGPDLIEALDPAQLPTQETLDL